MFQGRATPWRAKSASKTIITQKLLVILARRNRLSTSGCSNRWIFTIF